ncbi:MAG: homogentisate 1,2-dioxygenase [Bdellovibrio sp.]|nr:homogentisate 1,2-dioxygenase [Bdellovibrio sp.]
MKTQYLSGLGNHFSSEARPGALPADQNSPQIAPLGLYAEQLSGTAFTAPRHVNLFTWLYRIRPSVVHKAFKPLKELTQKTFYKPQHFNPNQMRWNSLPDMTGHFLEGLRTVCGTGPSQEQRGLHVHLYSFNQGMGNKFIMNADGDFLMIPQKGSLQIKTELGVLEVEPGEIVVVPRGMKFQVNPLTSGPCSGYVGENFGSPFRLPELGPIGANGLAHRRHFLSPVAAFEDKEGSYELIGKFNGELWSAEMANSPLDVVAWHGTYVPFKYDLRKFNTINTVSYDHPDPSIFTVLTSGSDTPGIANVDFAIFPPRWMVAENTFRPPYFHRNFMSEYMGLIYGEYDAKTAGGFVPGGGSLHNIFSAHGPDSETFEKASHDDLKPHKIQNTMAFMFESRTPYMVTDFALGKGFIQEDYQDCWQGFKKHFK